MIPFEELNTNTNDQDEAWKEAILEDLIEDAIGGAWGDDPAKASSDQVIVRVIRGTEFRNWDKEKGSTAATRAIDQKSFARRMLTVGDMVVEISGGGPSQPVGRTLVIDQEALDSLGGRAISSNFCRRVRFKADVNPFFVDNALKLKYSLGELNQFQTETTNIRNLTFPKFISETSIPLPTREVQDQLVMMIGGLQAQIGQVRDRLATIPTLLKKFRQSVLAAACSGQLTDDWREANPETETGQSIVAHLLTQTQDKKLKINPEQPDVDIPESWAWAAIGRIAAIRGGIQKQPHRAPKGNAYPYLRVANVGRNRLDLTEMAYFELASGELETYRLEQGDLLVVEGNGSFSEIGRASIWRNEIADCVHQNHIIRVRFSRILPEFVNAFWNSPVGIEQVTSTAVTTSGLYSLSTGKIASLMIPVPGRDEQAEIVRRVESLFGLADSIESRLVEATAQIERTTQAILAKAFRGEL